MGNQPRRLETSAIHQLVLSLSLSLSLSLFSRSVFPPLSHVPRARGVKSLIRFIARIKVGKEAGEKESREKREERKAAHVSRDIGCRLLSVIKRGNEKRARQRRIFILYAPREYTPLRIISAYSWLTWNSKEEPLILPSSLTAALPDYEFSTSSELLPTCFTISRRSTLPNIIPVSRLFVSFFSSCHLMLLIAERNLRESNLAKPSYATKC